jgi:arginyl-tRNA--protein-N-Asp/Glu arginylyltransferase
LNSKYVTVGVSQPFDCNYLTGQKEQLLVIQEAQLDGHLFEQLLGMGFRRNGDSIYKPRCPSCQACQSIRVPVKKFTLSKRQKRTMKINQHLRWEITDNPHDNQYALYADYISQRHSDGPMYPPSLKQFNDFLNCTWLKAHYIQVFDGDTLVAVAVTDVMPHSLSAIYSYFHPDYAAHSLGAYLILLQCEQAKRWQKDFVYLGYQIDENVKMKYKRLYRPYQILTPMGWQENLE